MAIYLVRHGHAGDRSSWSGDDLRRPLSKKGRRQAEHLADELDGVAIGAIFSSPATRCLETVEPRAERSGMPVREAMELNEGADPDEAIRFALKHAHENPVLSSHGDVIPKMLRRFISAGMRSNAGSESRKGSMWTLEVDGDEVVRGTYHPPHE